MLAVLEGAQNLSICLFIVLFLHKNLKRFNFRVKISDTLFFSVVLLKRTTEKILLKK